MQTNRLDGFPSTSFLTLLIVYSFVILVLGEVMYQGMFRTCREVKLTWCAWPFKDGCWVYQVQ